MHILIGTARQNFSLKFRAGPADKRGMMNEFEQSVAAVERAQKALGSPALEHITTERPLKSERGPKIGAVVCCHACEESIGVPTDDVNVAETFLRAHQHCTEREHAEDRIRYLYGD